MSNIILCGFMGCGKTTIGKMLASKLDMPFVDTDEYIENKLNMTIPEIFSEKGEDYFRQTETDVCKELSKLDGYIISTGGGTLLNPGNVEAMRSGGTIFLLEVSEQAVLYRLRNDRSRPLLMREDKEKAVHDLMTKRMPLYKRAADHVIDAQLPPDAVCDEITKIFLGGDNDR